MNGRYESFTVRVWASGDEILRGEVQHVLSGESTRFVDLSALTEFLARQISRQPDSGFTPPSPVRLRRADGEDGQRRSPGVDGSTNYPRGGWSESEGSRRSCATRPASHRLARQGRRRQANGLMEVY